MGALKTTFFCCVLLGVFGCELAPLGSTDDVSPNTTSDTDVITDTNIDDGDVGLDPPDTSLPLSLAQKVFDSDGGELRIEGATLKIPPMAVPEGQSLCVILRHVNESTGERFPAHIALLTEAFYINIKWDNCSGDLPASPSSFERPWAFLIVPHQEFTDSERGAILRRDGLDPACQEWYTDHLRNAKGGGHLYFSDDPSVPEELGELREGEMAFTVFGVSGFALGELKPEDSALCLGHDDCAPGAVPICICDAHLGECVEEFWLPCTTETVKCR